MKKTILFDFDGVISDTLFSAIVLMVIITTFIAPPWLKHRFNHSTSKAS